MNQRLILHIGANKTGSSAIQRFIQKNNAKFREHGFAVPDPELGWAKRVTGDHVFALQQFFSDRRHEIFPTFERLMDSRPEPGTVLISAENLSNLGNHAGFEEVCQCYDTTVIFYIRRQDDLITSTWQQWHSKIEHDINAWLINALRTIGHWEQIIEDWESVAGIGNVKVRLFQRNQFPNGNICWDFLETIGLTANREAFDFNLPDINPSFSDYIVPLVAGSKAIFKNVHDNEFFKIIHSLTGDRYTKEHRVSLISRKQRDNIVAFYEAENRRICKKFFPARPMLFDAVEHSKYRYLTDKEMTDLQLKFLTHMMFLLAQKK